MPFYTDHYRLSAVEAGQPIIPIDDSRRFLTIDRQLLGLFSVLGDGVIEGWDVVNANGLSVSVTPGRGHIYFMAGSTLDPRLVDLQPNAVNYVYAQAVDITRFTRDVRFFSDTTLFGSGQMILLAAVTTSDAIVESIDTSVRTDISFIETIKTLINQHRHRGAPNNPSKINLGTEVIGQLPGFRVGDFDAAKVVSGRLSPSRVPTLEHGDLLHSGVLSHAQLDSFVRNLSNENTRLLGELATVNMLQMFLGMKHWWSAIDEHTTNALFVIPGISPDSFTDEDVTTAVIDTTNHLIQGVPALSGTLLNTTFRTSTDFRSAFLLVNLDVTEDDSGALVRLSRPFSETIIESFDNIFVDDQAISGWTLETVESNSTSSFKSDGSKKVDGAFSAKLSLDQSVRVQVTKFFDEKQDWSNFNQLEVSIETLASTHGAIGFQILSGADEDSAVVIDDYSLLLTNEITSGFRQVIRDLTGLSRSSIIGIRMYTDSAQGWDLSSVVLNVDRIRLNNNLFFQPTGAIRFRFETPQKSQWAAISWESDDNGGVVKARARTGPSFAVFDQSTSAPFSEFIEESGANPGVTDNTNIEVELALASNSGKTASPVVRSVTLSFVTQSETQGLSITTADQFLRAKRLSNVKVTGSSTGPVDGDVEISGRVDVGDVVYGDSHSVQQVDRLGTPVVGVTGSRLPLSPVQAATEEFIFRQGSLDTVASVERLADRSYLVADTLNDRVMLLDRNGDIISGLASNNAQTETGLYPLSAIYNREQETLYVAWSNNVAFKTVDLSKFTITGAGLVMVLSNVLDTVSSVQGANSQLDGGSVLAVILSSVHAGQVETFLDSGSVDTRLFLNVEAAAVAETVNTDNLNYATLVGPRGLPVAVENITFINGIFRPVSVSRTPAGNWIIGNSKPIVTDTDGSDPTTGVGKDEITSVIEVSPDTGVLSFSSDAVDFSLLTLGGAVEMPNERYVVMAGIEPSDNAPAAGTATTVFDEIKKYKGSVKIVEKNSGRVVFSQPTSDGSFGADVQVDENENLVVVEKSFDGAVERGRVVKMDEDGNIFFQFGLNELSSPNDVRVLSTGNLVVST